MLDSLTFEQFQTLCKQGKRVPVYKRIPADVITPISVYQSLAMPGQDSFLLDSAENAGDIGRYSFMGFDPTVRLRLQNGTLTVSYGEQVEESQGEAITVLREFLAKQKTVAVPGLPPLLGGAMGYFSYDSVRLFEQIPDRHKQSNDPAELSFGFYDTVISFDHLQKVATISHIVESTDDLEAAYQAAISHIDGIIHTIRTRQIALHVEGDHAENTQADVTTDIDDEQFEKMVVQAKDYIKAGDVFQVVLSRSFKRSCKAQPIDVYRALRMINPSPYMFFLQEQGRAIVGASPERLVRVEEGRVDTMPIAGTRKRVMGKESETAKELLADPKEMAEHMMLVDLGRNDLGRISKAGTVEIKNLASIQQLSHVIHIRSEVSGEINDGCDSLDAVRSVLPAGTLSGAPKIRAMEIIDELENSRRGLYGGAVGYIDNLGNMDTCIAIRMTEICDQVATTRAGAGIVFDSDPKSEAAETRSKAAAVLQAIDMAERGLLCC